MSRRRALPASGTENATFGSPNQYDVPTGCTAVELCRRLGRRSERRVKSGGARDSPRPRPSLAPLLAAHEARPKYLTRRLRCDRVHVGPLAGLYSINVLLLQAAPWTPSFSTMISSMLLAQSCSTHAQGIERDPLGGQDGLQHPHPATGRRRHIAASSGRARTVPAASSHRHVQSHLGACGARAACLATSSSSPTTMATSLAHLPPAQPNEGARRALSEFSPGLLKLSSWLVFASTLGALSPPHPLRPRPTCA